MNADASGRLVIASNRLPAVLSRQGDGRWTAQPGKGGLVNALVPVLRRRGGLWLGWPGTPQELLDRDGVDAGAILADLHRDDPFDLLPVPLTAEQQELFYHGFSNEIIWPLFHDLQSRADFKPQYLHAYESVNAAFAERLAAVVEPDDTVWLHDYHLMETAPLLRQAGLTHRLGFFLHIPFPPPDIFLKLPWRVRFMAALLDFDLVGLQTERDLRNFVGCVRAVFPHAELYDDGGQAIVVQGDRIGRVGAFPISIDFDAFASGARSDRVAALATEIRAHMPERKLILGVDRLDYTKGIPNRLRAFRLALERYPELRGKLSLVQVVVPSRVAIPQYYDLKQEIERLVGEINGAFTVPGWIPIHYLYRSLDFDELLAYYRVAKIALITPLKDGMNLVAKEYCAVQSEVDHGILILSEFAGATPQLGAYALTINPYDVEGTAATIHRASSMSPAEAKRRLDALRDHIRDHDIYRWVGDYLQALAAPLPDVGGLAAVPPEWPPRSRPLAGITAE